MMSTRGLRLGLLCRSLSVELSAVYPVSRAVDGGLVAGSGNADS